MQHKHTQITNMRKIHHKTQPKHEKIEPEASQWSTTQAPSYSQLKRRAAPSWRPPQQHPDEVTWVSNSDTALRKSKGKQLKRTLGLNLLNFWGCAQFFPIKYGLIGHQKQWGSQHSGPSDLADSTSKLIDPRPFPPNWVGGCDCDRDRRT